MPSANEQIAKILEEVPDNFSPHHQSEIPAMRESMTQSIGGVSFFSPELLFSILDRESLITSHSSFQVCPW